MGDRRFLRFLVVGGLNTTFGYAVYALLIYAGLDVALALLLGTILGVLFNFRTTGTLVFGNRDPRRLVRFVGVYALLYFINVGAINFLLTLDFGKYSAGAVMLLPMALLAFVLNRSLVFSEGK